MFNVVLNDLKVINSSKKSMLFNFIFLNSFHVVLLYRISNFFVRKKIFILARLINAISRIIYSCDISPYAKIGNNFLIMHGFGIVIGADVIIGDNVKIYNDITIGNRKGKHEDGQAIIGNSVMISCGARILGKVRIGDYSVVGANAVVLCDIPDNAIAIGVPAKILYN